MTPHHQTLGRGPAASQRSQGGQGRLFSAWLWDAVMEQAYPWRAPLRTQ